LTVAVALAVGATIFAFALQAAMGEASAQSLRDAADQRILLTLKDGSQVGVPDFTQTNQPPGANATAGYQVAGGFGPGQTFNIVYFPANGGGFIVVIAKPFKRSRLEAEAALRRVLRLTNRQLCELNIDVGAPRATGGGTLAGRALGLSFCPGAVRL
jgi:hypothetical protein